MGVIVGQCLEMLKYLPSLNAFGIGDFEITYPISFFKSIRLKGGFDMRRNCFFKNHQGVMVYEKSQD